MCLCLGQCIPFDRCVFLHFDWEILSALMKILQQQVVYRRKHNDNCMINNLALLNSKISCPDAKNFFCEFQAHGCRTCPQVAQSKKHMPIKNSKNLNDYQLKHCKYRLELIDGCYSFLIYLFVVDVAGIISQCTKSQSLYMAGKMIIMKK